MNVKMLHVLHEFHAPVPPRRAPASRIAAASLLWLLLASPSPRRVIAALWLLLHSIQLLSPCHELRLAFCTARDTLPRVARTRLWRPALIAVAAPWRLAARLPPPRLASRHATARAGSRVGGRRGSGGGRCGGGGRSSIRSWIAQVDRRLASSPDDLCVSTGRGRLRRMFTLLSSASSLLRAASAFLAASSAPIRTITARLALVALVPIQRRTL